MEKKKKRKRISGRMAKLRVTLLSLPVHWMPTDNSAKNAQPTGFSPVSLKAGWLLALAGFHG